jgi:hypothetical protein
MIMNLYIFCIHRFKNQEKVDNFTKKLKKYIEPSGIKSISDILN